MDVIFFTQDESLRESFSRQLFRGPQDKEMRGEEILTLGWLKNPTQLTSLLKNVHPFDRKIILKMAYLEQGSSPVRGILESGFVTAYDMGSWPSQFGSEPQLYAELLYWSLRGSGTEKGSNDIKVSKAIIKIIEDMSYQKKIDYTAVLESRFYEVAKAQNQYNPKEYPLRRWLYEQFKDDDPYNYMNTITESTPNDSKDYPKL